MKMLEDIVNSVRTAVKDVKDYFIVPGKIEGMRDYAWDHYIDEGYKDRLLQGKTEEEKDKILGRLEARINDSVDRSQKYLRKLSLKGGFLNGLANFGHQTFHYLSKTPFHNYFRGYMLMVGTKALLEFPALYKYVWDTHDFYAAAEWTFGKALSGLVPIFGPAFDLNVLQRNIKKHAIRDGVYNFLIEEGLIEKKPSLYDRVKERVKRVAEQYSPGEAAGGFRPAFG
jgi:hypothetical protein